jgi:hypothetical protein
MYFLLLSFCIVLTFHYTTSFIPPGPDYCLHVANHVQTRRATVHYSLTRGVVEENTSPKPNENILKTVAGLSKSMAHHSLTPKVSSILVRWSEEWKEQREAWGLLNKPNLLHEVEESMVALELLMDWMDQQARGQPLAIVDVCCGKGVFSMLASYLFEGDSRICRLVMMDKDSNVDWGHIHVANKDAKSSNRPVIEAHQCNLFEIDETIEWLSLYNERLGLVGIHLCKNLSPTLVGIANALGPSKAPFLCLAPCCLPRVVLQGRHKEQVLEVASYESPMERQARLVAADRRKNARRRKIPCLLCESTNHRIQQCPHLPAAHEEQLALFQRAAALEPCWKCGELGHTKKNCPSKQESSIPAMIPRPVVKLNVSHIISDNNPFGKYCKELSTTVERESVCLFESKLELTESSRQEHRNNWNRKRKTIYIVAAP